jgi:hypothetical protein
MHLRSYVNPGQLMTLNSASRSHLDGRCAVTRTGQFRLAKTYSTFLKQFSSLSLAIAASHVSSHPLKYPVASLRSRLFGPSQLLAVLQYP